MFGFYQKAVQLCVTSYESPETKVYAVQSQQWRWTVTELWCNWDTRHVIVSLKVTVRAWPQGVHMAKHWLKHMIGHTHNTGSHIENTTWHVKQRQRGSELNTKSSENKFSRICSALNSRCKSKILRGRLQSASFKHQSLLQVKGQLIRQWDEWLRPSWNKLWHIRNRTSFICFQFPALLASDVGHFQTLCSLVCRAPEWLEQNYKL